MKVAATYLGGAYKFTDEEIAAAAFKINVQSALKAGKIVPAAGASITLPAAAAGETAIRLIVVSVTSNHISS